MKAAVLTGGSGFLGSWLLSALQGQGYHVYAPCRKDSPRRRYLEGHPDVLVIDLDMRDIERLPQHLPQGGPAPSLFFHLAWAGGRNDFDAQVLNIPHTLKAQKTAHRLGCRHFICTGSQAEYGIQHSRLTEDSPLQPTTAYGACKAAAYHTTRSQGQLLGLQTTWVRVFSVFGPRDNPGTLISYLVRTFAQGAVPQVSAALNAWDFLYAQDAAEALLQLGEAPATAPVYNLASGKARPLREYIKAARDVLAPGTDIHFGPQPQDAVWLNAGIEKIRRDTGWKPRTSFEDGLLAIQKYRHPGDE
ncbi:MAG: NAD-dependent epimerase/dehydratase family protein [Oscillospiraceae bacterium]